MALTDSQYRAKEARMEAGIVAGNALNAAAAVGGDAESVLRNAELFQAWLTQQRDAAGDSPFSQAPAVASGTAGVTTPQATAAPAPVTHDQAVAEVKQQLDAEEVIEVPDCEDCGGPMWDNRAKKQSGEWKETSPDFTCKDKACGGKVWPPKARAPRRKGKASPRAQEVAASLA